MKDSEWEEETRKRINKVAKYFKPKEVQTLFDFLQTGKDSSKD